MPIQATQAVVSATSNGEITQPKALQMEELCFVMFGHAAFQYLYAGCHFGVFQLLQDHPRLSRAEIGGRLGLEDHPTRGLLLGLSALRLLEKQDQCYTNSGVISQLFANGEWQVFYDTVMFEGKVVYPGQTHLVESLRTNTNAGLKQFPGKGPDLYHRLAEDPALQSAFYRYMSSWSRFAIPLLLDNFDFRRVSKIVDVGGGDATNAIEIARRYPNVEITLLELPENAALARQKSLAAGLSDHIKVVEGDMFKEPFPRGADCFLFIHQLVIWTAETNISLLRKAHEALEPGGCVIILNSMSADDETGPQMAALDTAYFLSIPVPGGMIYPWKDHERCLHKAGFKRPQRCAGRSWTPHGFIVAWKD